MLADPSEWGKMYARCADNHDQSPIKIEEAETVYDRVLSAPVLHGGWEYVPTSVLMLENNGHTSEYIITHKGEVELNTTCDLPKT